MFKNISKLSLFLIIALIVSLSVSLFAYFVIDNLHVPRTLFFPEYRGGRFSGETRRLPRQNTEEERIEQCLRELILGPFDVNHRRLVPENTKLISVLFRNGDTLFLDFSSDFVIHADSVSMNYQEIAAGVKMNISYNFPDIRRIIIAVGGEQLPNQS